MAVKKHKIYLVGSFLGFRDKIIKSLPQFDFSDPRKHRQACLLNTVYDDVQEAKACPITLIVFPKGKRGTMSYVEIGVSVAYENHLVVVDEDKENPDPLLCNLADNYFENLDDCIKYLNGKVKLNIDLDKRRLIESKYPAGSTEEIPLNTVYFCGTIDDNIKRIVSKARKIRPDRNFIIRSGNTYEDFKKRMDYDLVVANFPTPTNWEKHACFMIGGVYVNDINTLLVDDHSSQYPPLQQFNGLRKELKKFGYAKVLADLSKNIDDEEACRLVARRYQERDVLLDYITEVDNLNISSEAVNMYGFFQKENQPKK